ncbi:hypothetical protein PN499_18425 [Kamptonema animale CS-326]|jgi:hypothetical protein|uniref:hypothetical protein n=1 Tax=Kamptonema animale TaxID=92934 RepID=UPI00232AF16E|nr:hypothetical protein [Kamptonema animale]MDB9513173.1 hypothetical protein [Kamptonema animale CS-326]
MAAILFEFSPFFWWFPSSVVEEAGCVSLVERSIAIAFLGEGGDWNLWAIAEQIQLRGDRNGRSLNRFS